MANNILLKGCALVIDDEINPNPQSGDSQIRKIVNVLKGEGSFFIELPCIPNRTEWSSFSGVEYIILDWDLNPCNDNIDVPDGVEIIQGELKDSNKQLTKDFIKYILENYFIPIFLFSKENDGEIKRELSLDEDVKRAIDRCQIDIKDKDNFF